MSSKYHSPFFNSAHNAALVSVNAECRWDVRGNTGDTSPLPLSSSPIKFSSGSNPMPASMAHVNGVFDFRGVYTGESSRPQFVPVKLLRLFGTHGVMESKPLRLCYFESLRWLGSGAGISGVN